MYIGEKKSQLKDDAALYKHDTDNLTEKEKLQRMNSSEKWKYFKDYYLFKLIAVVVCAGFVISLLYTMLKPKKDTVFTFVIGDYLLNEKQVEEIQTAFEEIIITDFEKQDTYFENDLSFLSYESYQKLSVLFAVGDASAVLVKTSVFEEMAPNNYFYPLSEVLPTELYTRLLEEGRLVYSETRNGEKDIIPGSGKAYGINLSGTKYFDEGAQDSPVIAVCSCWKDVESAVSLIELFLK